MDKEELTVKAKTLEGAAIAHHKYGDGKIKAVCDVEAAEDVHLTFVVGFDGGDRTFVAKPGADSWLAFKSAEDEAAYKELVASLEASYDAECEKRVEALKANMAERKAKQAEDRRKAKEQREIERLMNAKPTDVSNAFSSEPKTLYEALAWMAKHAVSVKAKLPSHLEAWFVSRFGDAGNRYVVPSSKRTSGGFAAQWGLGLKITFDSPVPSILSSKITSSNPKAIDNVGFVWELVERYGFQFTDGRQNVEEILDRLPDDAASAFGD